MERNHRKEPRLLFASEYEGASKNMTTLSNLRSEHRSAIEDISHLRIIVIGSGFGGLSAAIRLQAQGHAVTIIEKRDKPGGRGHVYEQDGFTFDGGPPIFTAPRLVD